MFERFAWIRDKLPDANQVIAIFTLLLFLAGIGTLHLMRQTMFYSERAYIFPLFAQARTHVLIGSPLVFLVPFTNGGHTPAYQLRVWIIGDIFDGPQFPSGEGLRPGSFGVGSMVYYPGIPVSQPLIVGGNLDQAMLDSLESGHNHGATRRVYIWGRIEYLSFGRSVFTQFCYYATHNTDLPPDTPWEYTPCEEGNDGD